MAQSNGVPHAAVPREAAFIVAYGVEDRVRLKQAFGVPDEFILASPAEFSARLLHTLDLAA
mgnify:CR=1 FL=1